MRLSGLIALLVSGGAMACTAPPARPVPAAAADPAPLVVTGRYRYAPNAADSTAGCTLDAAAESTDSVRYLLDCNRGAPSYNMGMARGILGFDGTTAVARFTEYGDDCTITFAFSDSSVSVTQSGPDFACGFGNAVSATGLYTKVNGDLPAFEETMR